VVGSVVWLQQDFLNLYAAIIFLSNDVPESHKIAVSGFDPIPFNTYHPTDASFLYRHDE